MMATARRRTISVVPYFCHAGLRREGTCSTTLGALGAGEGAVAGADDVAICFEALPGAVVLVGVNVADGSRERIMAFAA
jgi:hypothetical protein